MIRFTASLFLASFSLLAAPCTDATEKCTERLEMANGGRFTLLYRSYPLTGKAQNHIRRAMIIVHGASRNADDYFATGLAAAFLAKALDDTIIIAPRFAVNGGNTAKDPLAPGEISWHSEIGWAGGGEALGMKQLSTYDVMDKILKLLADKRTFPNMRQIVVSGHSAGGQYASRYAALNQVHETLGVPVKYVPSNASTMLYLDAERPSRDGAGFRRYSDRENCTTYDDYKFGLQKRTGYAARLSEEQIRTQLTSRPVTYLQGELDTLPIAGFDSSCPAMAQGPDRFSRAKSYFEHVKKHGATKHEFVVVALCGHNNRCIWTADNALPVLFPALEARPAGNRSF